VALIKRAWTDEAFADRVRKDPRAAFEEVLGEVDGGTKVPRGVQVKLLDETCGTLYLVLPPAGAPVSGPSGPLTEQSRRTDFDAALTAKASQDAEFRAELLRDPKAAYQAQLTDINPEAQLPEAISVEAFEESTSVMYLRLPAPPPDLAQRELSDEELREVAGGAAAVGVAITSVAYAVGIVVAVAV
jgi:hypothetical protein